MIEIDQALWRPPSSDFVRSVVERLVQEARFAGYELEGSTQWSDGYFEATHAEANNIKHRVVVWVDWSLQQPGRVLRVYCRYQKMKKYSGEAWSPVPTTDVEEQDATKQLQDRFRKIVGL